MLLSQKEVSVIKQRKKRLKERRKKETHTNKDEQIRRTELCAAKCKIF
jgi:hypothetical protein